MNAKKVKKKKKTDAAGKDVLKQSLNAATEPDQENPFDFGGLPNRDLKKNLGCG